MLQNYIYTAVRNILKNKLNFLVNVTGLLVAFICCILIFLMVYSEFRFDNFHKDGNRVYKLYTNLHAPDKDERSPMMGYPVSTAMKTEVPGVELASPYMWGGDMVKYDQIELNHNAFLVNNDFFNIFSFGIVEGNVQQMLTDHNSVVLSQTTARRLFGSGQVLGKAIDVKIDDEWKSLIVTGVIQDPPENSSLRFRLLASIELKNNYQELRNNWNYQHHAVYIKREATATQTQIEERLRSIVMKYKLADEEHLKRKGYEKDRIGDIFSLRLLPLRELHFDNQVGAVSTSVSKTYLYIMILIAVVILFIACFNFVNLNVARSFARAREVGIRKSIGAGKGHIFVQMWMESFMHCLLALLLAVTATFFLIKPFNQLFVSKLNIDHFLQPAVLLTCIAGMIVTAFLAGGYPSLLVSRFNVVKVLKGKFSMKRSPFLRNGLITFQFIVASLMICSTIVIYRQFQILSKTSPGFEKDAIISIPVKNTDRTRNYIETLRMKLASQPQVLAVTGSSVNLGLGSDNSESRWSIGFAYKDKNVGTDLLFVDYDFLKTLGIKPVAGRDFSREFGTDTSSEVRNVILTKKMVQKFGEENLLGATFFADSSQPRWNVIGIIPDFHLYSMYENLSAVTISMNKDIPLGYILVKVKTGNLVEAMDIVRVAYSHLEPDNNITPTYVSDNMQRWYEKEKRLSTIFSLASVIAVTLSCSGLFAIISLIVEQRKKEISIRKVLGATVLQINSIVSKSFLLLVLLGLLIATPIAWYFLYRWLENFPLRTPITIWTFLLAGSVLIFISIITMLFQTIKVSLMNPIKNLRND